MTTSRLPPAAAIAAAPCGRNGRANAATMSAMAARAHQQQEPVPDPPPPHRLIGNLLHEHQRRKLDHPLPLALNQMHQHRNRDGRQTDEEERGEKRHR